MSTARPAPYAFLGRLRRSTAGMAITEFALMLPVVAGLLLGVAEVGRFIVLEMKVESGAANMADLMTRSQRPTIAKLQTLFKAVPSMMAPFPAGRKSRVLVSIIVQDNPGDPPYVCRQIGGGGAMAASSRVGDESANAVIPDDLTIPGGSAVVAAEFFYEYEPWLFAFVEGGRIHRVAFFRPRRGSMRNLCR